MSVNTAANLFMVPPLRAGFYQHLIGSAVSFQKLGNRLIRYAEYGHAVRQIEMVKAAAEILSNFPLEQYQSIGQYYLAWCERKNGDNAASILEKLAGTAPAQYRARAMHVLATIAARKQDIESEFCWLTESLRVFPSIEGFRGLAVIKAREGFHTSALKGMEALIPLIRHAEPLAYYDFLNSYAVELGETGRKQEARNISQVVLASPFAYAYPEWQETANDLRGSSRSFAVIDPSPLNTAKLYRMPLPMKREVIKLDKPASVTNLQQWKKKMGKEPNGNDKIDTKKMSERELILKIIELSSNESITEEELRQILDAVIKITSRRS
jgi:hypothetical protein